MSLQDFTAYKEVLGLRLKKAASNLRKTSIMGISKTNGIQFYHCALL